VAIEADVRRSESKRRGGIRYVGRARNGERKRRKSERSQICIALPPHIAANRTDLLLEHNLQIAAPKHFRRACDGDHDGAADRRVPGEGKLASRGENAQRRGVHGIARLEHERRLRHIELAGDCLHVLRIKATAIKYDGKWIAGERTVGEDIKREEASLHFRDCRDVLD
jgi:hypothetical protein